MADVESRGRPHDSGADATPDDEEEERRDAETCFMPCCPCWICALFLFLFGLLGACVLLYGAYRTDAENGLGEFFSHPHRITSNQ